MRQQLTIGASLVRCMLCPTCSMDSPKWDNSYSLGLPEVDEEHQALFRILGELEAAVSSEVQPDVEAVLERLLAYSTFHFRSEEALMRASGYPGMEAHVREHRKFTSRLTLLKLQLFRKDLAMELVDFGHAWIRTHILESDRRFGEYLARQRPLPGPR